MKDSSFYLLGRLYKNYIGKYLGRIIIAIVCMIIVAATTMINAWMIDPVLNKIFLQQDHKILGYLPMAIVGVAIIKGSASYIQNIIVKITGQKIVTDIQMHLYDHLLHSDLATLTHGSSGKLISRFTNDVTLLRSSTTNVLTGIARELLTLIFLIGLMVYQSLVLSTIIVLVFPAAVLPIIKLGRRMRRVASDTQEELGKFTSKLDDTIQGIRVIKSYVMEDYETNKAKEIVRNIVKFYTKAAKTEALSSPIMEVLIGSAIALVIWYGGIQVISGTTTPGEFFSFIGALLMAYRPVKSLSDLNNNLQEGLAAAGRLFKILDIKPSIKDSEYVVPLSIKGGEVVFDKVSFSYMKGSPALSSISFRVPSGNTVGLVGPSGGGKSTITNLLLRLYDPKSGRILIDGQDIKGCSLKSLRDSIAIVSQDIFLFDDTIKANISYGNKNATIEEIVQAAKAAAAHDFIMKLPAQYDTNIGQRGLKISGGQRQRIAIARAILKDAPILLLDEATSSLDSISEKEIQKALIKLRKGRTTLCIAHRLSTIEDADIIYVIKRGKIVESGTHNELIDKFGEYYKLYSRQTSN